MPIVLATPPISVATAHAFAAFFTLSYVGSLYLSKSARLAFKTGVKADTRPGEERAKENDERWRNDPDVIRARLVAASLSTALSGGVVYWLVRSVALESKVCLCPSDTSRATHYGGKKKGRGRVAYGALGLRLLLASSVSAGRHCPARYNWGC